MIYEDLEQALEDGKRVQICSINDKGQSMEWFDVDRIIPIYDVSRFRIIDGNKIIDGNDQGTHASRCLSRLHNSP